MQSINCTDFKLTLFSESPSIRSLLFVAFLNIYVITIIANTFMIILRLIDSQLHTPMYFFLSHLAIIDIIFTSTITPKLLSVLLSGDAYISFSGCVTQMFISLAMGSAECLLLAIMAYDRRVAICQPLRYHVLLNQKICVLLASSCWVCGFIKSLLHTVFTFIRPFCKTRELRHFVCEIQPLLKLSCDDIHNQELALLATAVTAALYSFLLILCSYIHIISTILKIQSSKGRSKLFSTCSSHLIAVIIFYGTIMSTYMRPISSYRPERDRVISLLYTMGIPMCNPLIYSMRNKEIKAAARKATSKVLYHMKTRKSVE